MPAPDERHPSEPLPALPVVRGVTDVPPAANLKAVPDIDLESGPQDESTSSNQPKLTAAGVDPFLGQQFGGYELTAKIGQGGMGVVYRGRQVSLDRVVAVKILNKALYDNPEFIKRFEREAKSIARINHPNILAVYDFGKNNQLWYMVTEFVEGSSLSRQISERLVLAWDELAPLILQCLSGLSHVGQSGIVHRDIKPDNILITREGIAKIADFGLAKDVTGNDNTDLTTVGMAMGTPAYMSPEQCMGRKLDGRSDIYSLGIAAYLALTGEKPFTGQSSFEIMTKQREYNPPPPHQISKNIPPQIGELVMRMMAKNPSDRWRDAEECRLAWQEAVTSLSQPTMQRVPTPIPAAEPVDMPPPVKRRSGEIQLPPGGLSAMAAAGGGVDSVARQSGAMPINRASSSANDPAKPLRRQTQELRMPSEVVEVAVKPGSERHPPTRNPTERPTTERRLSQRTAVVEASTCPKCGMLNRSDAANCSRCQHILRSDAASPKNQEAHADRLMEQQNYLEAAGIYSHLAEREQDKRARSILRTKEREARSHSQAQQVEELRSRSQTLMARGGLKAGIEVLERGLRDVRDAGASSTAAEELIVQELDGLRAKLRNRRRIRVLVVVVLIAVVVVAAVVMSGMHKSAKSESNPVPPTKPLDHQMPVSE